MGCECCRKGRCSAIVMAPHPLWPHTISHRAITAVIRTAGATFQLGRNQCLTSTTRAELKGKTIRALCWQVNASSRVPHAARVGSLSVIIKKRAARKSQNVHASRGGMGDRKWALRVHIRQHRSAKYSSNLTPDWLKTWPFISAADSTNLMVSI